MAERPTYKPQYVESAETIIQRMVGNIPDDWHKEPGDFIYDAVKANPAEIMQLEQGLDDTLRNAFPQYCDDDKLDDHVQTRGITRTPATHAVRILSITADSGVKIPQGYTVTSLVLDDDGNPIQFAVRSEISFTDVTNTRDVYVICHSEGTIGNIPTGSQFTLQPPIPGIRSIVDLGNSVAGAERENSDDLWTRYLDDLANRDTGGNVHDYTRWVLNDFPQETGIVIPRVIVKPCYNGNGTVQVAAIGSDYGKLSAETLGKLQTYLDPIGLQGKGYGRAPAGAWVDVCTGTDKTISITATVEYKPNVDPTAVKAAFEEAVADYLQSRVFVVNEETEELYPVTNSRNMTLLCSTEGIEDYRNVRLNGGTSDVELDFYEIPVLGTVVLNE